MAYPFQYDKTLTATTKLGVRVSNDFGTDHYGIQAIKMGFNHFLRCVTFQFRGLNNLELHSI